MIVTLKAPHTKVTSITLDCEKPFIYAQLDWGYDYTLHSRPGVPDELLLDIQRCLRFFFDDPETIITDISYKVTIKKDREHMYMLSKLVNACACYRDYTNMKILHLR